MADGEEVVLGGEGLLAGGEEEGGVGVVGVSQRLLAALPDGGQLEPLFGRQFGAGAHS